MSETTAVVTQEEAIVDEKVWNAWVQLGRVREKAIDRKMKVFAGALVMALIFVGIYFLRAGK